MTNEREDFHRNNPLGYRTRSGDTVEIITSNGRKDRPFVGYIGNSNTPDTWGEEGYYYISSESSFDLVDVTPEPEEFDGWLFEWTLVDGLMLAEVVRTKEEYEKRLKNLREAQATGNLKNGAVTTFHGSRVPIL